MKWWGSGWRRSGMGIRSRGGGKGNILGEWCGSCEVLVVSSCDDYRL
jgi:hypothetical protein